MSPGKTHPELSVVERTCVKTLGLVGWCEVCQQWRAVTFEVEVAGQPVEVCGECEATLGGSVRHTTK